MRATQKHPGTREPLARDTGRGLRPFQVQLILDKQAEFPFEVLAGNRRQACELALPKWWRVKRLWHSRTSFVALRPGGGWAIVETEGRGGTQVVLVSEGAGGLSFSPVTRAEPGPRRVSRFLEGLESPPVFADCDTAAQAVAACLRPGSPATDLRHLVGEAWLFEWGAYEGAVCRDASGEWLVSMQLALW